MPWIARITDNFNRTNETPLAGNWGAWASVDSSRFNLTTNGIVTGTLSSDSIAGYTAITFGEDQYSKAAIFNLLGGTNSGTNGAGVVCRFVEGSHTSGFAYYRLTINDAGTGNVCLRRRTTAGVSTTLVNYTSAWSSGDILELRVQGSGAFTVCTVLKNSVELGTIADTSGLAGGMPGLAYSSAISDFKLDNWEGGEFVTIPPITRPMARGRW